MARLTIEWLLIGVLLLFNTLWDGASASLINPYQRIFPTASKRFGQSVIEEGLPLWLERRAAVREQDESWQAEDVYPDVYDAQEPEDFRVEQALEHRGREQLKHLRQLLNRKQSGHLDDTPVHVVRRLAPSPDGVGIPGGGLRSHMVWQPLALGLICSVFGIMVIVGAVMYYQKVQLPKKRAQEAEFAGLRQYTKNSSPSGSLLGDQTSISLDGDRKLAHSAQMYHYQHQKQQMLAVERASDAAQISEEGSESDVEEGDFTVYECPGLAATGELEVENPLYEGESANNGPSTNGSYGEIVNTSDLEDTSDSTPTTKAEEH